MTRSCATCEFWECFWSAADIDDHQKHGHPDSSSRVPEGWCKRFPPQLVGTDPELVRYGHEDAECFPSTSGTDWCGEHADRVGPRRGKDPVTGKEEDSPRPEAVGADRDLKGHVDAIVHLVRVVRDKPKKYDDCDIRFSAMRIAARYPATPPAPSSPAPEEKP